MLKKLVNECKFSLQITTVGPLLVKSGYATPHGPDMSPVLTYRNGQEQVFIPGSSLKGVFRSHVEKVIRSLKDDVVCVPFGDAFCGDKFENRKKKKEELTNEIVYHDSCPACRLFGSTYFIGRIAIGDAYLTTSPGVERYTEKRDGVGIDRFSGGAANRALFNLQVVSAGTTFQTDVYLRNFEIWQLGAVMLILQDMEDELIRVGSGRSRGLGHIKGTVSQIDIQYIQPNTVGKQPLEIWGLGKFLNSDLSYGTQPNDVLVLNQAPSEEHQGIRLIQKFTGAALMDVKAKAMNRFVETIQNWNFQQETGNG